MSNPFFSIIVPAHNSQEFISKGLRSISEQTFHDYELIVVCDNCTDVTENIACRYGAITYNVSFGRDGLSRDYGIEHATGEWILFMDDDDWFLHEYVFQQLYDKILHDGEYADMVAFSYIFRTKGYTKQTEETIFKPRVAHVWSDCWRRSAIGNARFGNAVFSSDTYFLKAMKNRVEGYILWDMPMYYYNFMRPGSQTDLFCKGIIRQSPVAE